MATKEDILEQIVEEYLAHQGYFVRHNIKYLPRKDHPDFVKNKDSNHSDIDVLGFHPKLKGYAWVVAVNCKSWQDGFKPTALITAISSEKTLSGRPAWKGFRELTVPKWSEAFVRAVKDATGSDRFTYMLAVAHVKGDRSLWQSHPPFLNALNGNPIRVITFDDMVANIQKKLTKTLAATEVGRMLQMFKLSTSSAGESCNR
jgi:hypothetical protein